jgi:hypothetical protein
LELRVCKNCCSVTFDAVDVDPLDVPLDEDPPNDDTRFWKSVDNWLDPLVLVEPVELPLSELASAANDELRSPY